MSLQQTIYRPYNSILRPNERKREMLQRTFDWMERAYSLFFDLAVNLFGGVTYESISGVESDTNTADNICATLWFRLKPRSESGELAIQTAAERINRFTQYAGHAPSELAASYLSGSYDPAVYEWVDCRVSYRNFCQTLGVNLDADVRTMVDHGIIPVLPGQDFSSYKMCSELFGSGQKEDKSLKVRWFSDIANRLRSATSLTWDAYRSLIQEATGCRTSKEINAQMRGRPGILAVDLDRTDSGDVPTAHIANRISQLEASAATKSKTYDLPNRFALRDFIALRIGTFDCNLWAAPSLRAFTDIQSKNSNNLRYSAERLTRTNEINQILADNPNVNQAQNVLQSFWTGQSNSFVVENRHLGDLKVLYDFWQSKSMDEGIKQFCDLYNSDYDRQPVIELLRHIYPHISTITADLFHEAARLNRAVETNNRKKVHPTVHGKVSITWGKSSTVYGTVTPPNQIVRNQPAGSTGMIWMTMTLLDSDGVWRRHHIPTHNSRFYEEIYAYRDGLPLLAEPRIPMFGHRMGNAIADPTQINQRCKKASKQFLRTNQNMTHNVVFDPATTFTVTRIQNSGEFSITISSRVQMDRRKMAKGISVGDRLMGVDQNQTYHNTYSVWEVVEAGTPNSHEWKGHHLRLVEDGFITSVVNSNVDQLSYSGIAYENFAEWRKARQDFTTQIVADSAENFKHWTGQSLYQWNKNYARYLLKLMNKSDASSCPLFKSEIVSFLNGRFGIRLGSLDYNSLEFLNMAKALVNSYFSRIGASTPDDRSAADPDLNRFGLEIEMKRVNKRKEKANRIASSILVIAQRLGVSILSTEKDLPTANLGNRSSANRRAIDWCVRKVKQKLTDSCGVLGIRYREVNPIDTSHIDLFVYEKGREGGKEACFMLAKPSEITEKTTKNFFVWAENIKRGKTTTTPIYHNALRDFAAEYQLDFSTLKDIKHTDLARELLVRHGDNQVLIPCRGGRWYMSTHRVSSSSHPITYAGRNRYINRNDILAAANIALRSL